MTANLHAKVEVAAPNPRLAHIARPTIRSVDVAVIKQLAPDPTIRRRLAGTRSIETAVERPRSHPRSAPMAVRETLYLDLLRSLSAAAVFLGHATSIYHLGNVPTWGHEAVIVFFVLSGYVICHVADTRETNARDFLIARMARLWSVVVPAMLLTVACDLAGRAFGQHPSAYAFAPFDLLPLRVGAALLFLSESWVSIQPLSNGVVWSLCAEFWYYMIFAAWVFAPAGRIRFMLVGAAALLAGHKALLLLPIWLMGVALQRSHAIRRVGAPVAITLSLVSLAAILFILLDGGYYPATRLMQHSLNPWIYKQLAEARVFWFDWIFGALVAVHVWGARHLSARLPLERIATPLRWCAGLSFATYLFHMPLLTLCAAFLSPQQGWLAVALSFAVIATLGGAAERSKGAWRRGLAALTTGRKEVVLF